MRCISAGFAVANTFRAALSTSNRGTGVVHEAWVVIRNLPQPKGSYRISMIMRGSRPRANDSSCTSDVAYLYAFGTPLCMIIINRCKSPSHNSVVAHVYTSVYGGLVPMYSIGCPSKIQIRKPCGLRRLTWTDGHVMMRDGGG